MAPGRCPLAYARGLRTSRSTKSAPFESASCTSQQSVSSESFFSKCERAVALSEAGGLVTAECMRSSCATTDGSLARMPARRQWQKCHLAVRIGHESSSGSRSRLRRPLHLRIRLRCRALRPGASGASDTLVRFHRLGGWQPSRSCHGWNCHRRVACGEDVGCCGHDRHSRLARS